MSGGFWTSKPWGAVLLDGVAPFAVLASIRREIGGFRAYVGDRELGRFDSERAAIDAVVADLRKRDAR